MIQLDERCALWDLRDEGFQLSSLPKGHPPRWPFSIFYGGGITSGWFRYRPYTDLASSSNCIPAGIAGPEPLKNKAICRPK
jgi:hypothetical protein